MNDLEKFFYKKSDRLIHKWNTYFDLYEKAFSQYRRKAVRILEIGVDKGGSLQMWKDYFGPKAEIVGMDINPECEKLAEDQISIFIGDQGKLSHLKALMDKYKSFDIIIDDGSHQNKHQIGTFIFLFDSLAEGGTYLVEDTHTSYLENYEGGLKGDNTFIEFGKELIDAMHGFFQNPLGISRYSISIPNITFGNGIVFLEKRSIKYTPHDIISEAGEIVNIGTLLPKTKIKDFLTLLEKK